MTTALAAQLAQIRKVSNHPLDLKAQKKAHSKSLLFDSKTAATQDFDSIFQICLQGFDELCHLDQRYSKFKDNLFSEQSKDEDRTLLTHAQNVQLDVALHDFLALISSRVLLQPALIAIEWLVRRFRVHEHNLEAFVLTFLPYHDAPIFPTMLSILPGETIPSLKFLRPYIQSLTSPPRHSLAYAASHNKTFFAALNAFILKCCQCGYQSSTLISFWAGLVSEALATKCNESRSASLEAQRQQQEEVTRLILAVASDSLTIKGVPDLRAAMYMIITVLASKADLDDEVLKRLMLAVVSDWEDSSQAGLICIVVLVDKMQSAKLPSRVTKALMAIDELSSDLSILKTRYRIDPLVLSLYSGLTRRLSKTGDKRELHLLRRLFDANLLSIETYPDACRRLLKSANQYTSNENTELDIDSSLSSLILDFAGHSRLGPDLQEQMQKAAALLGPPVKSLRITRTGRSSASDFDEDNLNSRDHTRSMSEEFELLASGIPTKAAYEVSFLSHSESYVFGSLEAAFSKLSTSATNVSKFSALPVIRKSMGMSEPLFLSFYVRVWCGSNPGQVRAAAIRAVTEYFAEEKPVADPQFLMPYMLYGLSDSSPHVREAMGDLILHLQDFYTTVEGQAEERKFPILGREQVYGQLERARDFHWLPPSVARRLLIDIITPGLEECLLDQNQIFSRITNILKGTKNGGSLRKVHTELKTSVRAAIFACLCSHVSQTPLVSVKLRLLPMLNKIEKIGNSSRPKLLMTVLRSLLGPKNQNLAEACAKQQIDYEEYVKNAVGILAPNEHESMQTLQNIIEGSVSDIRPRVLHAVLEYTARTWRSFNNELQTALATSLLRVSLRTKESGDSNFRTPAAEALETLSSLPLGNHTLTALLYDLPPISNGNEVGSRAAKRRRLENHVEREATEPSHDQRVNVIKQVTVVLELVDQSQTHVDSQLLPAIFTVFTDLKAANEDSGEGLSYLQAIALERMLAIVEKAEGLREPKLSLDGIETDLLLDCIKSSSSPQVRNTGLLLLSALAHIIPEQILHNVMPIFTFMGSDVLRQGDDYSAHVVRQTMDSIVPRLVQSLHKRKGELSGISELLLSFAAAFDHVPSQRRLDTYMSLLDQVGPDSYLFAFVAILLNSYPRNRRALSFAVEITNKYSVQTRLKTVGQYTHLLLDSLKAKPAIFAQILPLNPTHNHVENILALLPFLPDLLSTKVLVDQTRSELLNKSDASAEVQRLYEDALGETFLLSESLPEVDHAQRLCMRTFDSLLGLLPMSRLVEAFETLLARSSETIRKQIVRSFDLRMGDKRDLQSSSESCLQLLPRLITTIEQTSDATLHRMSLNAMDNIIDVVGKRDIDVVKRCVDTITDDRSLKSREPGMRCATLLCLSTCVEAAGEAFIPLIPRAMPAALEALEESMAINAEDKTLHNAAYSFFTALFIYIPFMVSGQSLDRLLRASYESANSEMGKDCDEIRSQTIRLIAKRIDANVVFEALERTWTSAMEQGPTAVKEYMELLRLSMDRHPKSAILSQSQKLGDIFLKAFDLRRIQCSPRTEESYTDAEITDVENAFNESAIAMVYKLNDATFRPLFTKACEWAYEGLPETGNGRIYRKSTWYTFLVHLFSTLKSIVTNYANFILEDAAGILRNPNLRDGEGKHLWQQVIHVLHATFEHDQDEFYHSPSHFTPVSNTLLSQISHADKIDVQDDLIPAIVELAVAADSSIHHKQMNAAILQHMHSDRTRVRLAAVQCELALTSRLGEEWLALLPEMLPLVSELQEDDDEVVEKETLRWIQKIEETIGESLAPMLQ
ncbi:uncharacterized protein KY384_006533 [Bacidia gigantensis]|uniref:uncharacterized protein n=1 Tax=Bacidia gigantensis TaxID=2732470 RepID=UPI001D044D70|nr:uncharacterized protein KY384_006533 [Bacidia gigantensis]KAG8528844.1 hypothetical protein KY384_006533 [Bacidia gigantensis]